MAHQGEESKSFNENGVSIEVKKSGNNSRNVRATIVVNASLESVWSLMTDYERYGEIVPGLTDSKLIDKKDGYARVYQMSQQNLPLGVKFRSKMVLDCWEKEVEILDSGRRREIEFKMVEGDFQSYQGKWTIQQANKSGSKYETTLTYDVDVKPKPWLPVHLVEGRLSKEVQANLFSIRDKAQK